MTIEDIKKSLQEVINQGVGKNAELASTIILDDEISIDMDQLESDIERLSFTWSSQITAGEGEGIIENGDHKKVMFVSIKNRGENIQEFFSHIEDLSFYIDSLLDRTNKS